jgi:hypothetical protein
MELIQRISNYPLQTQVVPLPNGSAFSFELYYRPIQRGWFFNFIRYVDFEVNSLRVVLSGNLLNQFRNKLPFGLACISPIGREPQLQDDFSSEAVKLYLMNAAEVQEFSRYLTGV